MGCGCGKNNKEKKIAAKPLTKEQSDAIMRSASESESGSIQYRKLKSRLDRGDIEGYRKMATTYEKRKKKYIENGLETIRLRSIQGESNEKS